MRPKTEDVFAPQIRPINSVAGESEAAGGRGVPSSTTIILSKGGHLCYTLAKTVFCIFANEIKRLMISRNS